MSFIGPRPLLAEYLNKYSTEEIKRHNVKPGITGLSQVTSLKKNSWSVRLKLDLIYVKNISFNLDLKIFIKTFMIIILRKKMYNDYQKLYE
jgi:lipopolysaccharide/colanic/teichoic acid biosynthesis glycosyltransferase